MSASPALQPAAPGPHRAGLWARLVTLLLLAVFLAIGWIQAGQIRLLDTSVYYTGDNLGVVFYQLELEYLKLRDGLREARRYPQQINPQALRERYELFASRVPLVQPERLADLVAPQPEHVQAVGMIRQFMEEADPVLSEGATAEFTPEVMDRLLRQLDGLAEPIHDMTLMTIKVMGQAIGDRNTAARQQNYISISLTVFQGLLTLGFAILLVRQVRALEAVAGGLEQARRDADVANVAKSAFLANMSHELRTPLNGMLGMLSLVGQKGLSTEQADQLQTAQESAQHLLGILNDILDVSKLESNNLSIETVDTDLHQLTQDTENLMSGLARAKGLHLRVNLAPSVPQWVRADGMRLKQILLNLLSNAIKFSDHGQVVLDIETHAPAGAPAWADLPITFRVTDHGIGMDKDALSRLFQRFSQADASTSRRYGGSGLGLEISRSLARLMGGDITVTSAPGQGSVFTVALTLPVVNPDSLPQKLELPTFVRTPGTEGLDILVAEDQLINRKYMAMLLERMGHRVRFAEDGEQAVAEVQRQTPDVVLMDFHMPVMDGLQATRQLRAGSGPSASVPVIALTADAFEESRQQALAAGMTTFLTKPVSKAQIELALTQLFGARGASVSPAPAAAAT